MVRSSPDSPLEEGGFNLNPAVSVLPGIDFGGNDGGWGKNQGFRRFTRWVNNRGWHREVSPYPDPSRRATDTTSIPRPLKLTIPARLRLNFL